MAKDTFYFPHDYNARSDPKIKKLIRKHGFVGYGIYWAIVEDLYDNANALPTDYETIAYDFRTDENTIESIIKDFDLFVIEGGEFGSLSIQKRLSARDKKSAKARESARKRWDKIKEDANALHSESDPNAIKEKKVKESKGKEKKVKEKKEPIVYSKEVHDCFLKCLSYFPEHLHPNTEIKKNNWLDTLHKLNTIDNLELDLVRKIVKKARADDFWSKNFLSLTKLRKSNKDDIKFITVFYEKFKKGNKSSSNNIDPQDMQDYLREQQARTD